MYQRRRADAEAGHLPAFMVLLILACSLLAVYFVFRWISGPSAPPRPFQITLPGGWTEERPRRSLDMTTYGFTMNPGHPFEAHVSVTVKEDNIMTAERMISRFLEKKISGPVGQFPNVEVKIEDTLVEGREATYTAEVGQLTGVVYAVVVGKRGYLIHAKTNLPGNYSECPHRAVMDKIIRSIKFP